MTNDELVCELRDMWTELQKLTSHITKLETMIETLNKDMQRINAHFPDGIQ